LLKVCNDMRQIPDIRDAKPTVLPQVIAELSAKIRDDREDLRGFYRNHMHANFPAPELIDEEWSYYRWIQVHLLAGLDFINRYGKTVRPGEETLMHEVLDLTYLINALLIGGLASRDSRILERFKFLRSDGVVLR